MLRAWPPEANTSKNPPGPKLDQFPNVYNLFDHIRLHVDSFFITNEVSKTHLLEMSFVKNEFLGY